MVTLMDNAMQFDTTIDREMTGLIVTLVGQENLGKPKENPQITPTIEVRNRSMSVLEEEIAMIK